MKRQELESKLGRRSDLKDTLDKLEQEYEVLKRVVKDHDDSMSVSVIDFVSPTEHVTFDQMAAPCIPVAPFVKAVGEAIDIVRKQLKDAEEELKEIVEFED